MSIPPNLPGFPDDAEPPIRHIPRLSELDMCPKWRALSNADHWCLKMLVCFWRATIYGDAHSQDVADDMIRRYAVARRRVHLAVAELDGLPLPENDEADLYILPAPLNVEEV